MASLPSNPTAANLISWATGRSLKQILGGSVGGLVAAFFLFPIQVGAAMTSTIVDPLTQMGTELAGLVTAYIGGGARIVTQGSITSAVSLEPGATFDVGPFTFGLGIAAMGVGVIVLAVILAYGPTSNWLPFSFTDLWPFGVDEEEDS